MTERPHPDIDRVRRAMREHDEDVAQDEEATEKPEAPAEEDDGDT
jgi:hypothetical protein